MIPPHLDFKYLKRTISISRVLADKGLISQYKARGDKLTGPCPVHGGDNPGPFVSQPYTPFLEKKTIHPETVRRFEAGVWSRPGFLNDCSGVRLHDPKGKPIGYAGRRLNPFHCRVALIRMISTICN
jgi:hypothetical protein